MSSLEKSLGKRRDWPQLEAVAIATLAAGSAADPAQDLVVTPLPDMTKRWPINLGEGMSALSPLNSMTLAEAVFVSGGAANTAGNATNNADLRINLWRNGVLQGCLAYYPLSVATTLGTIVSGQGTVTVTPASMSGIVQGMALGVDTGSVFEVVYPYNITATTFTASFQYAHATSATVTTVLVPFLPIPFILTGDVNTTSSTAIAAPGSTVITPASMYGIHVGDTISITGGTGTAENVVVTAVAAKTFTATFANTHSGTYTIQTVTSASAPFTIRGGDVLSWNRLSNNVTGIATPVGQICLDWVPAGIGR